MKVLTIFKKPNIRKPAEYQKEDSSGLWRICKFLSFGVKKEKNDKRPTDSDIFKCKTSIG